MGSIREDVSALREQLIADNLRTVFVFATSHHDLARLARELERAFPVPVIGSTAAGVIGPHGYQATGLSAVGLYGNELTVEIVTLDAIAHGSRWALEACAKVQRSLDTKPITHNAVGILLVDGPVDEQDRLRVALQATLPQLEIVGASAGARSDFLGGAVLSSGTFCSATAALAVISGPFSKTLIRSQHFAPITDALVVTASIPEERVILELDGEPAAHRYAEQLGLRESQLSQRVFAEHPFLVRTSDCHIVRAIEDCAPEHGLRLRALSQNGQILRIGTGREPQSVIHEDLARARQELGTARWRGALVFEGIMRQHDFRRRGILAEVGNLYAEAHLTGFCAPSEHIGALRVNFTLTGVAFGEQ